jgi:hypothetical protein
MITRRASEIIRQALTLSQIQNTDALSWRDKIDMLNQSYVRLYDDINNSGDLYYSKEVDIKPEDIDLQEKSLILPKDFWKLLLLGNRSEFGEIIPIQRAPNSGQYSGYRIVNDKLFYNNYFAPGSLVMRYIPQPQTIAYPRPGRQLPGRYAQAAYDSLEDVIILAEAGRITIIDSSRGVTLHREENDNFVIAISEGVLYVVKETGIICYDYEFNVLSNIAGSFELYAHSIGWEQGIIVSNGQSSMRHISGKQPEVSENFWNFMDGRIIKTLTAEGDLFIFVDARDTMLDITYIFNDADSYVIADPYIYVNKAGTVGVYKEFEPMESAPALIGRGTVKGIVLAEEANNTTGYGVIFHDYFGGLRLEGFSEDTVMNYPQNIFFDWIVADLAVKFRIALDIPTGELPSLAADYHDTLMNGLSRDAFQSQRINNVYGRAFI